jgi:hypothetical protein
MQGGDALEHVPFSEKKSRFRELRLAVSVERIKGKGTLVSAAAKSG